jgi:hypothetical protein
MIGVAVGHAVTQLVSDRIRGLRQDVQMSTEVQVEQFELHG